MPRTSDAPRRSGWRLLASVSFVLRAGHSSAGFSFLYTRIRHTLGDARRPLFGLGCRSGMAIQKLPRRKSCGARRLLAGTWTRLLNRRCGHQHNRCLLQRPTLLASPE
ncbi:hypothetical protein BCV70DRAFT_9309 [Testicularia cyperi]|uniref:Uncharacterized protein n=1 Tax=Testicularia cyperi TaxID=1882483 RepID=A0A317Y034_9BASI|nr:hypothetical protein BCV70DRAFT_9309 [Testicularia cyperi]